ncbi:MAG: hypothetical protein AAB071_02075 [Bacteroidota bacterium]
MEKKKTFSEIEKEVKEDLQTNPRYQDFFSQYSATSVIKFILDYAKKKAELLEYGERSLDSEEYYSLQFTYLGERLLWEIQQKKLFNLQCMWRAEQIEIPEIETTFDFSYWGKNITCCTLIPPINADEIELYKAYLRSGEYEPPVEWICTWQNYSELIETDDDDFDNMPAWYIYWDTYKGKSPLLTLPDIRGEKEWYYIRKRHEHQRLEHEKKNISASPIDTRPMLYASDKRDIIQFMQQFENHKLLRLFQAHTMHKRRNEEDETKQAFDFLRTIDEAVEIEANNDWGAGLVRAAEQYRCKMVADELENVFLSYCQRNALGILHTPIESERWIESERQIAQGMKEWIIEGRLFCGEPGDLNF